MNRQLLLWCVVVSLLTGCWGPSEPTAPPVTERKSNETDVAPKSPPATTGKSADDEDLSKRDADATAEPPTDTTDGNGAADEPERKVGDEPAVRPEGATNPPPPARDVYMGRRIAGVMAAAHADWLTRPLREREEATGELLKQLEVKPGMTVCDLGCGNGYHTLRLAKLVGEEGKVYAVDIQPKMLELLMERAKAEGVANITPVLGAVHDPKLPVGSCDLILLVDVYHEFSHPQEMLKRMHAALKPTGRIALVEFRAEDPDVPIRPEHKMSKKQIMTEFPANGFKLVRGYDGLPWQHLMFFQRDVEAIEK